MSGGDGDDGEGMPAEVAASFENADLRGRLASDDYMMREAAQAQLSAIYRRAYGDGEASGQAQAPPSRDGRSMGYAAESDVPPAPQHYSLHPDLDVAPGFSQSFRGWTHAAGFGVRDVAELAAAVVQLTQAEGGQAAMPAHIRQSQSDLALQDLASTEEGQQVLGRASRAWAALERYDPELAEVLHDVGVSVDPVFIRKLAVAPSRHGGG